MEGCLSSPPKQPWNKVSKYDIYSILKTIFHTLTVAMRYEPANAKFFETEVSLLTNKKKKKQKKIILIFKGEMEKSNRFIKTSWMF
jgi:hypothetical protein